MDGLGATVSAALEYGISSLERSSDRVPPVPTALFSQARLAARSRVPLEAVLRRYFAGYALLSDYVVEEAANTHPIDSATLKRLLRRQAALFDRVLAAVAEEYRREAKQRIPSSEQRRVALVERLLAGELLEPSELSYDFDTHHVGAIASGPMAEEVVRELAALVDARLLFVRRDEDTVWGWLGGRTPVEPEQLQGAGCRALGAETLLALGEPAEGLTGWRLTHRQARAAMPIARSGPSPVVRYGDAILLAAILQGDFHTSSIRQLFIAPIEIERDSGAMAFETLRAYFAAERNAASAAAALGISRQAVNGRLQIIGERLGQPVNSCAAELEVALKVWELEEHLRKEPVPV